MVGEKPFEGKRDIVLKFAGLEDDAHAKYFYCVGGHIAITDMSSMGDDMEGLNNLIELVANPPGFGHPIDGRVDCSLFDTHVAEWQMRMIIGLGYTIALSELVWTANEMNEEHLEAFWADMLKYVYSQEIWAKGPHIHLQE